MSSFLMVSVGITQRFARAKVASDFASLSLQRQHYGSRGAVTYDSERRVNVLLPQRS
jgi:hypothetical protein